MKKANHFDLTELVSEPIIKKYGKVAWSFFDPRLIDTIDFIRDKLNTPIIVNNWATGGKYSQRGFRENTCNMVSTKTKKGITYCSAHCFGQALDFDTEGYTAQEVRDKLSTLNLPYNIRVEGGVSWVHIDVRDMGVPIYTF